VGLKIPGAVSAGAGRALGLIRRVLPDHWPGKDRQTDKHCREGDQHKLSNRRQMPAQQGNLPGILRHQLFTNTATLFHNRASSRCPAAIH
jgi:hypothetical protein